MTDPPKPGAILVVDDEESTLRGVQRTLRSKGYQDVITCSDSRQASQLLADNKVELLLRLGHNTAPKMDPSEANALFGNISDTRELCPEIMPR